MRANVEVLRPLRERSGYTQTGFARLAGIDRANYAHIEAGRRPGTPPQLVAIAKTLNVGLNAIAVFDAPKVSVSVA